MAGLIERKKYQPRQQAATVQPKSATVATPAAANAHIGAVQPTAKGIIKEPPGGTAGGATGGTTKPTTGGYQPGAGVLAAQEYLNNILNNKPTVDPNLSALYEQIMNREDFTYDLNGDALYQQYKDRYQTMGQQAMMDTMGNAAAMTGGYGSSYASTAGNQAYQQHLQGLNDIVPELYQQAYNRYAQEGADLMNQYNMAYGLWRDQVGDWENNRDYAAQEYWNQYGAGYNEYANDRDYAYNLVMAMIKRGKMPSPELLAAAGLTEDDAKKLGAKTGGSGKKSNGGSNPPPTTDTVAGNIPEKIYGLNSWAHFYPKK